MTRALLLSTYVKFVNLFPEIKHNIQEVFKQHSNLRSADAELQQRASEYLQLSVIASTDVLVCVLKLRLPSYILLCQHWLQSFYFNRPQYWRRCLHSLKENHPFLPCLRRKSLAGCLKMKFEKDVVLILLLLETILMQSLMQSLLLCHQMLQLIFLGYQLPRLVSQLHQATLECLWMCWGICMVVNLDKLSRIAPLHRLSLTTPRSKENSVNFNYFFYFFNYNFVRIVYIFFHYPRVFGVALVPQATHFCINNVKNHFTFWTDW